MCHAPRQEVGTWGGRRSAKPVPGQSGASHEAMATPQTGQKTFEALDHAIKQILDECYAEARRIVNEKREYLERVTQSLLQQETLSREEFLALMA